MKQGGYRKQGAALALGVLLALNACGLDKVDLSGPGRARELALSLKLCRQPGHHVTADGFSTSLIRPSCAALTASRWWAARCSWPSPTAPAAAASAPCSHRQRRHRHRHRHSPRATTRGIAQAAYKAPPRTQFPRSARHPRAGAAPSGRLKGRSTGPCASSCGRRSPASSSDPRQRSRPPADSRWSQRRPVPRQPGHPLQTTSFDTDGGFLVRYEWFFGDGTVEDSPDTAARRSTASPGPSW